MVRFAVFIILVVFNVVSVYAADEKVDGRATKALEIRKECMDRNKDVTLDLITGFNNGTFPENKALKCYTKCEIEKLLFMRNDKFDYEGAMRFSEMVAPNMKDGMVKAVEACRNVSDKITDPCEIAYTLAKCWKKNDPNFSLA